MKLQGEKNDEKQVIVIFWQNLFLIRQLAKSYNGGFTSDSLLYLINKIKMDDKNRKLNFVFLRSV